MTSFGAPDAALKSKVREHWEDETCGTRYGETEDRKGWFRELSAARYSLEPYILPFAGFDSAAGKEMLEIGVGAGADFENWCKHARHATGVDLTDRAIELTSERLQLEGVDPSRYTLRQSDAERLPFPDGSFDLVYSWGVLHHTPDTPAAFREVFRVLRSGGRLKAMIYHVPSWTGLLLLVRHGWMRGSFGMSQRTAIFDHLESAGTKAYTVDEARSLVAAAGFGNIEISTHLGPGDVLSLKLSRKYDNLLGRVVLALYPRWLIRLLGHRFGLNLMIEARKA
jgi:ubiquinone/menaquinone biosynthesis C-methylase UbiE